MALLASTECPLGILEFSPQAKRVILCLKTTFTLAPGLTILDPAPRFVVEVDASDSGVGAVLPQHSHTDNRLDLCAFLSRKLSSTERNYDVGNRQLLAIQVALEEWRHWLEGAELPFLVWADHKNLQ